MTLDLAYLEDFQALVDAGNFSRAAAVRAVTQPAFSRRIRALEAWAGAPLFDRDAQPITLTEAGRALRPAIIDVLRGLIEGKEAAQSAAARSRAVLRFAATHVLSFTFFPSWLRGLEDGQPLETVHLVSDSLLACEQMMLQGQVQFLLCHHHASAPVRLDGGRFRSVQVGTDTLCLVVAPDPTGGPLFTLPPRQAALPYLAYSDESGLGRIVTGGGPAELKGMLDTVFTSHLAAALRTMTTTGRGIAWLPLSLIAEDLAAGRLVRASAASFDVNVEIQLLRTTARLAAGAERFWASITRSP